MGANLCVGAQCSTKHSAGNKRRRHRKGCAGVSGSVLKDPTSLATGACQGCTLRLGAHPARGAHPQAGDGEPIALAAHARTLARDDHHYGHNDDHEQGLYAPAWQVEPQALLYLHLPAAWQHARGASHACTGVHVGVVAPFLKGRKGAPVSGDPAGDIPDDLAGLLHVEVDLVQRVQHPAQLLPLALQGLRRPRAYLHACARPVTSTLCTQVLADPQAYPAAQRGDTHEVCRAKSCASTE